MHWPDSVHTEHAGPPVAVFSQSVLTAVRQAAASRCHTPSTALCRAVSAFKGLASARDATTSTGAMRRVNVF
jgi:hypothetical protein